MISLKGMMRLLLFLTLTSPLGLVSCTTPFLASDRPQENVPVTFPGGSWTDKIVTHEAFLRAYEQISTFAEAHDWKALTQRDGFLQKFEIYGNKNNLDVALVSAKNSSDGAKPSPTTLAAIDKRVLRALSWPAYQKLNPKHTMADYERMLAHELAHQLHLDLIEGQETALGPLWFREGFAVLAAGQFEGAQAPIGNAFWKAIRTSEPATQENFGALVRKLVEKIKLNELIQQAGQKDFENWLKAR